MIWKITPLEVKQRLDRGEKISWSLSASRGYAHCHLENALHIPMGTIPANLQKLDTDEDVICYCHHGMRSLDVANWLRGQGVASAKSMAGGIERLRRSIRKSRVTSKRLKSRKGKDVNVAFYQKPT